MPQVKDKTSISVTELNELLGSAKAPVVVDVRSSREYKAGHIPGAIHLPFWTAPFQHEKIKAGHQATLVLTCAHGPRAKVAKFFLGRAGFRQVMYLDGHMVAWKGANLPLARPKTA